MGFKARTTTLTPEQLAGQSPAELAGSRTRAVVLLWRCTGHDSGFNFNWFMSPEQADDLVEQLRRATAGARGLLAAAEEHLPGVR